MAYTTRTDGKPIIRWTEEMFLEHADVWLEIHERAWPQGEEQTRDLEAILVRHGVGAGARLLDAPSGFGRRAVGLAEEGFDVTAVDANAMGIEAASTQIPRVIASRLRFRHADRESLPGSEADPFDAILSLDHPLGREDGARPAARH